MNEGVTRDLSAQVKILGALVALMWGLEIVDWALGGYLNRFGIMPRSILGLRGILFAPLLHGGFGHLLANTVPFVALGWLVMVKRTEDFFWVTAIVMGVSGLGTWLLGAPRSIHIGASGVVFGYFGFLIARACLERSLSAVFLAIVAGSLYGGLIWGISPFQRGISWEGHLFGLIGGGIAAWLLAKE